MLQAHDKEYIAWASEDIRVDGKLMEHVSFQSFVRKFGFTSKEAAMSQYEQLLNSSRLSKTRRERLRATYDDFVKTHLDSFWLEWDRELANYEFDASCETVVKRTATLAQQASLAMSARGFSAVQTNSTGHNARADAAVHKGNDSGSSSNDENNDNAVADEETATASSRSDSQARGEQEPLGQQSDVCQENNGASTLDDDVREDLIDEELSNLLAHIAQVQHSVCEWRSKDDDACIACLFQQYQRECVQALHNDRLHNADIADAMAIIGVFAPFLQTQRMRAVFSRKILSQLVASSALPDPDVDDAAVLKAIRLRINNRREDASQALGCMDRKLRIMFDNLLEFLPEVVDRSISEVTFTVNYVAPVLNCILKIDGKTDVQYPNTDCHVQKHQGSKPDRPDILVKAHGHEILYGTTSDLSVQHDDVSQNMVQEPELYSYKIRSESNRVQPIASEDMDAINQLEISIRQLPYKDPMPIDLLLNYPEEQEVANVPSIAELIQTGQDEEEEEAEIVLESKLTPAQVVDMMDEVALFWMLSDRDSREQIAMANKLSDAARDLKILSLVQSTLDDYVKN
ncbi:hypothetical protein BGZ54_009097 [Gamsiella multidivaricata]|nr:hypothetical protein BGZ54_009097 [Gamsiella multidivaricata]